MSSNGKSNTGPVTSDLVAPVPTPHWGAQSSSGGGAFTVRARCTIRAPVLPVLQTLLDTKTWPAWNKFVSRADLDAAHADADGVLRPSVVFTEHVDMKGRGRPSRTMRLAMTALEELRDGQRKGWVVVWLGKGYPDWALRSERVHEVYVERGNVEGEGEGEVETVYNVYETFSGPLAWVVKVFVGKALVARFGQWNAELKEFVERDVHRAVGDGESKT